MNGLLPHLLVIDDDLDFCTIVTNNLGHLFAIHSVGDLASAIEHLKTTTPAIMLLDNHLPDGLGAKFVSQCLHTNPTVRIIMVSADGDPELKQSTLEAGASLFLLKPFDMKTLRESVQRVASADCGRNL